MQVTYPTAKEINDWEALGNEHWSWDDMQPYYRKFQTFARPSAEVAKSLGTSHYQPTDYGSMGPIQVGFYTPHDLQDVWLKTFETLGHRMSQSPLSGAAMEGLQTLQVWILSLGHEVTPRMPTTSQPQQGQTCFSSQEPKPSR
jgi:choline dehydrogenase-like flavoprotein